MMLSHDLQLSIPWQGTVHAAFIAHTPRHSDPHRRDASAGHPRVLLASDIRQSNERGQRKLRIQRPNSNILPVMDEAQVRSNYIKVLTTALHCGL